MATRVVQWATGAVGRAALQELIENPDFQLVGVLVYDPAKAGQDAGSLCGLPPTTGVLATTDKDEILALGADVVVHAASKAHAIETNAEDICRLLAAGTNVITTTSYNHLPTYGAETEAAFVDACRAGESRFHAAGENPGFMFERLVATVTGLSKTIDRIDLYEATDVSAVDSRPMLVDLMGMGRPPEDVTVDSPIIKKLDMAYRQALNATADVLGIELSHIDVSVDATTLPTTSRFSPAPSKRELLSDSDSHGSGTGLADLCSRSTRSGCSPATFRNGDSSHWRRARRRR